MSQTDPAQLTVVLTGGGSGGHITPLLAIAAELKRLQPEARLVYIGQYGDNLADIASESINISQSFFVRAGKFRRFYGEGLKQLFDIPTLLKNLRDSVYVVIGLTQSRRLLKKLHPDIIFIKGGFIGVPVGLAAASLHLPYITHDSDAIPGLANRIISRWAHTHAVALPGEVYSYPAAKTVTTGIPIQAEFVPVTDKIQEKYRHEIEVPLAAKMLFVIGGGLGAQRVNIAVAEALPHLLSEFPDLYVVQSVGRANEADMKKHYEANLTAKEHARVKVFGYLKNVYKYSGAADVIVTRAGATNLAEFSLQGKACLIIPSPFLTGGHQLKNAQYLADHQAAVVLQEADLVEDPNRLAKQVSDLLRKSDERYKLGKSLSTFAKPNATQELAKLILQQAKH